MSCNFGLKSYLWFQPNCTPLSSITIINTQCGIWLIKAHVVLKLFYRLHFVLFFFFLREWNVHQVTHISGTSKLWCGLTQSPESGHPSCSIREISNWMLKVIWDCIRFALLQQLLVQKSAPLSRSIKCKTKTNHDLMFAFSCASGSLVILLWILIGSWRSFPSVWLTVVITFIGFDFKTLNRKALYYSFVNCTAYHLSVCHHNPCNKLLAQSICWVVLGWPVWNRVNCET